MITPIPVALPTAPKLLPAKPNLIGYGQGWTLSNYRGRKLVWHTGSWPGMVSRLTLAPDQNVGVMVMTSTGFGGVFNAVTLRVLDAFFDTPKTDWNAAYGAALVKSRSKADESSSQHEAARNATSKPSSHLSGYAAIYRDP